MFADQLSPPRNISITISPDQLIFIWSPVTHNCSAITYNIISAPDCGNCQSTTNSTSATCIIQRLVPNEERICTVRVQAIVCDNIQGKESDLTTIKLAGRPYKHKNISNVADFCGRIVVSHRF